MTKLMEELTKDPTAVFDIGVRLPSGNFMRATVGPMIGDKLCFHIELAGRASDRDIADAKEVANQLTGQLPDFSAVAYSDEERQVVRAARRQFLGGGQG